MLNLLVIRSDNPEETAAFYELFLPPFEYHRHGNCPMHYSVVINDVVLEIYPLLRGQESADRSARLGFQVDDLDQILERLAQANHTILTPATLSDWGYRAIVQDPDGRKVELTGLDTHKR